MIRIYSGVDSFEKRKRIFELVLKGESTVITPPQSTLAFESQMIELLDLEGLIDTQVTSFKHLLEVLSRDIFTPSKTPITKIGKRILFRSIHESVRKELKILLSFEKEGFYEELESTIEKLQTDHILPDDLKKLLKEEKEESLLYKTLHDLILLYERFLERMHDEYFDEEEKVELFLKHSKDFGLVSTENVWLLDFKHFDYNTKRLIECIEKQTKCVHIVLSLEEESAFEVTQNTKDWILRTFPSVEEIKLSFPNPFKDFATSLLEEKGSMREGIRIFEAKDIYEEVEFVGLDILKKLRQDPSLKLSDIRIITSDLGLYGSIIKRVFEELGLFVFSDSRKPILKTRVMKSVFALLNIFIRGFSRDDVIGYLRGIRTEDDYDKLDLFENELIERGIDYDRFFVPFEEEELEAIRQDFLSEMLPLKKFMNHKATLKSHAENLREALIRLHFPESLLKEQEELERRGEIEEVAVISQIWETFVDTLTQLQTVSLEDPIELKEFRRILASSLKDVTIGIIPPREDRISIVTLHRSTHESALEVYFTGFNDGLIPREPSDHGLFRSSEKDRLKLMGYDLHDTMDFNEKLDELDFVSALSLVGRELTISYALSDYSKDQRRVSRYLKGLTKDALHTLDDHYYEHPSFSKRRALEALKEKREEELINITEEELERLKKLSEDVPLTENLVGREILHSSVSRLETFNSCPFRYFVRYDLLPKERKDFKIQLNDIGTLYHSVVENAVEEYVKGEWTLEEMDPYLDKLIQEIAVAENYDVFREKASGRYFLKKAKRIVSRVLRDTFSYLKESVFVPMRFEESVSYLLGQVTLYGKIDRIDENDSHFRIVDYKSGSKRFDMTRAKEGLDLQLLIYANAYEKLSGKDVSGVYYSRIQDPLVEEGSQLKVLDGISLPGVETNDYVSQVSLSESELKELREIAVEKAKETLDRMNIGDISAKPVLYDKKVPCTYCNYASICRFDPMYGPFRIIRKEKES
ncbi:PD-(D/E)XK nuclease family protein [Guggenheimella bovis]